jgi:hypothetical protein
MIDIWVKLVSNQYELAMNLTRAVFGLGAREEPVSIHMDQASAMVPDQADAVVANPMVEPQKAGQEKARFAVVVTEAVVPEAVVPEAVVPEAATETPRQAKPVSGRGAGKIPGRRIKSQASSAQAEAATIKAIMSFLKSAEQGATVRAVAEHLKMDKKGILPLLKTLVKEGKIDELLGRYCVLKS